MIRAAVLGADVGGSLSPAIHRAAWAALGISGRYLTVDVPAGRLRRVVRDLGQDGFTYLNVTIPHKRAAAALADRRGAPVRAAGAANTLIFSPAGRPLVRAENTDGDGVRDALFEMGAGPEPGDTAVVVGAGGAAAAAAVALARAGAAVRIVARRPAAARRLKAALPAGVKRRVVVLPWTRSGLVAALEGAAILVSAVPAAAWAGREAGAGLDALARYTAVLEMAYGGRTPLAQAVRRRSARYADGVPMLVHQAAHAVELALGARPPLAPMFLAARRPG